MVEITYPMVLSTLQTAGLLVGIFYYVLTLRNQRKNQQLALETRQAQLYTTIWNQSINNANWMKNFQIVYGFQWKTLAEHFETCPWNDFTSENFMALWQVGMFFEGLSPIFKQGSFNLDYFFPSYYWMLSAFWRKLEPIIVEMREQTGPTVWCETEYLYNILTEHLEKHPELDPSTYTPYQGKPHTIPKYLDGDPELKT